MNSAGTPLMLWRLLDRRQRHWLLALQFVSVLMALSTVSGMAAVLPFFAVLSAPGVIHSHAALRVVYERLHFGSDQSFLVALGIAFVVVVALANALNLAGSMLLHRFAYQVGDAFHVSLFEEYLRRDYGFHLRTHSSVLATNVIHETGRVTSGIVLSALTLVSNLLTVAFIMASMVMLNPLIAVCAIVVFGASYGAVYLAVGGTLLQNGRSARQYFARRSQIAGEGFAAIKEIILYRAQSDFVSQFARCCAPISDSMVSTLAIAQGPRHALEIATVGSLVIGALYMNRASVGSGVGMAQLGFVAIAAYRLLPALQQVFSAFARMRAERAAFDHIAGDLQQAQVGRLRQSRGRAASASTTEPWRGRPRRELRLEAVSFRHGADRPASLSNITLRIAAGSTVGLVGPNGSGKTTLADLLAGLLVPESGRMQVDGTPINAGNRSQWRSAVAYVPQRIVVLDSTLAQNIALGEATENTNWERMHEAVRLARMDECVAALPRGYEEMLGERGCRLSGGQLQRLGIARALYREASLLIMDEATSALDVAAEQEIMDALHSLGRELTVVLIAHRLNSLRHCDVILELEQGRIARSVA
jgi:ATP-binding cassette, subfamily B, bacterial PglK